MLKRTFAMSGKRRANVMADFSSSEDESSIGRQGSNGSIGSNYSSENRHENRTRRTSKRPCLNRNALMARENRQRKKEYLEKVENKLSFYRQENKNLSNMLQRQSIDLKRLTAEVSYLRSVLNNSSGITNLLKSMNATLAKKTGGDKNGGKFEISPRLEDEKIVKEGHSGVGFDHTYTRDENSDHENDGKPRNYEVSEVNREFKMADDDAIAGLNLDISDNEFDKLPKFDDDIFNVLEDCPENIESLHDFRHDVDDFNKTGWPELRESEKWQSRKRNLIKVVALQIWTWKSRYQPSFELYKKKRRLSMKKVSFTSLKKYLKKISK